MIHTEEVLRKALQAIRQQREVLQSPVHALILGDWGVGKTKSAQKITKEERDTFYMRLPHEEMTRSKLIKLISYSVRAGYRQTVESTLDLLKYTIDRRGIKPILFVDEAGFLFRRQAMLDTLKELAEDEDIGICYIFLAPKDVAKTMINHPHSLHKRIILTKELEPLTEKTVKAITEPLKLPPEPFLKVGLTRKWTTIDIAFVSSIIAKGKLEPTEENIEKIAATIGR
jgi:DNA transposition AAA+ family ATPase